MRRTNICTKVLCQSDPNSILRLSILPKLYLLFGHCSAPYEACGNSSPAMFCCPQLLILVIPACSQQNASAAHNSAHEHAPSRSLSMCADQHAHPHGGQADYMIPIEKFGRLTWLIESQNNLTSTRQDGKAKRALAWDAVQCVTNMADASRKHSTKGHLGSCSILSITSSGRHAPFMTQPACISIYSLPAGRVPQLSRLLSHPV